MNVVIPREDGSTKVCVSLCLSIVFDTTSLTIKGEDHSLEIKRHKFKDMPSKKVLQYLFFKLVV